MKSRKKYMKEYNQKKEVKAKKAEFMRKVRQAENEDSSRRLVQLLLNAGFENLAFEYALERAPEMLVTEKARARSNIRKQ